ncbi:MAG: molecular chaperone Hsp33 [Gammaproteobacteria bacterium]|jgi:molecular chaperone Hsp33
MNDLRDHLHRFLFNHRNVRGELVRLDETWQALLARQDYPPAVRELLGQAAAATALLAATIKFDGSLILQIHSEGPLRLLVVECSGKHTLRGLARWNGELQGLSFADLLANGRLVMTIDPGASVDRYQGIVSIEGASLAECLQHYFDQSEQLPTRLWLAVDDQSVAGLLIQEMPAAVASADAETWNRIATLAATISDEELLRVEAHQLLHRLFNEEQVTVFEPQCWQFSCRCSRERVALMLEGLGRDELDAILREEGAIKIDCEYCSEAYHFDAVDVEQLFRDALNYDPPLDVQH